MTELRLFLKWSSHLQVCGPWHSSGTRRNSSSVPVPMWFQAYGTVQVVAMNDVDYRVPFQRGVCSFTTSVTALSS